MPGVGAVHRVCHSGESRNPEGRGNGARSGTLRLNPFNSPMGIKGEVYVLCTLWVSRARSRTASVRGRVMMGGL